MSKDYTIKEMLLIEYKVKTLISNHDKYGLRELCSNELYALEYFVSRAIEDMATLEHIKNIIK